jgi:hypothetical protein
VPRLGKRRVRSVPRIENAVRYTRQRRIRTKHRENQIVIGISLSFHASQ